MKHLVITFLIVLIGFSTSCRHRTALPNMESVQLDTLFTEGKTNFELSYDFASIKNASKSPALQSIETSNIQYFFDLEEFEGTAHEAIRASIELLKADFAGTLSIPWTASISAKSEAKIVDTLLVYTIDRSEYTGGAHGLQSISCHNYSIEGGYELASGDLFTPEEQDALLQLIHTKLYEQFEAKDDQGLANAGLFPGEITLTENFAVTPEGITFIYNPYDIACFALGLIEVSISNEELAKFIHIDKQTVSAEN
ncbi:MAG: RsiV family protein [Alistipes sp.]